MAQFKTLKELLNSRVLENAIEDALSDEVFEEVREVQKQHIISDVYAVYPSPYIYKRRGDEGGLADDDNIGSIVADKTLIMYNDTPKNDAYGINDIDKSLTEIIITGEGYMYRGHGTGAYLKPRDFVENTKQDLIQNKQHIKAMKQGLKNKGIDVK